jgi:hypothetical protein
MNFYFFFKKKLCHFYSLKKLFQFILKKLIFNLLDMWPDLIGPQTHVPGLVGTWQLMSKEYSFLNGRAKIQTEPNEK